MWRIISKYEQVHRVSALAPTFLGKINFIISFLWLSVRHRIKANWDTPLHLKLRYNGTDFDFFAQFSTDVATLDEVFIKEDYAFPDLLNPYIIIDAGSNMGISVKYFRIKYPQAQIYAFEPDPAVFKFLKKNVEEDPWVTVYNATLSDKEGSIDFYVHPKSNMVFSLYKRFPEQVKISTPSYTLTSFMREVGVTQVDLVKFDVEGAEVKMFTGVDDTHLHFLIGELHTNLAKVSPEAFGKLFPHHTYEVRQISQERYITILRKI